MGNDKENVFQNKFSYLKGMQKTLWRPYTWFMLTLLHDENCLSCNLSFISGKWHNYWEISRPWPRDPKSFQQQYSICIRFYVGLSFSSEGILFGHIQKPCSLWFMMLVFSWDQSGWWPKKYGCKKGDQGNKSLVMYPGHLIFQAYGSSQLSSASLQPLGMLGCNILSLTHNLWSCWAARTEIRSSSTKFTSLISCLLH